MFRIGILSLVLAPVFCDAAETSLSGSVSYETLGYPDANSRGDRWENFFELLVRGSGRIATPFTYQFEAQALADDAGYTEDVYSFRNTGFHRSYLSLISAVVHYQATPQLRFSIGRQVINWSIIDEIKPAGLMMWREESDIFRRTDHGVDALSARYAGGSSYLELSVVPFEFVPSTLPHGRWNVLPSGVPVVRNVPSVRASETQAGLRAGLRLGDLDASIVGYAGRSALPVFQPGLATEDDGENPHPIIAVNYPRLYAAGFTASYSVGEATLLRAETVYFASSSPGVEDFLQAVVGAEYSHNDWRFLVNYLQADKVVRDPQLVLTVGERRYFQEFLFGEFRYDAGGSLRARVRGGYDFAGEFFTVQPEVSYQVWGDLEVALVAEGITSSRFSYFDVVRHEDRVGTRLRYYF